MDVRHRIGGNDFVWDAAKAVANRRKHGVRFEDAATAFLDPLFAMMDASRNDEGRDAIVGFDNNGRLLFVVHIEIEGDHIRIVSARRAERNEEKLYAK